MFSGSSNPTETLGTLYDQPGSGKSKMAASTLELTTYISACRWDRNKISTAKPTFSRSGNPIGLRRISLLSRRQVKIQVFQVYSRHLVFSISSLVVQYSLQSPWIAWPGKCRCSRWDFISISPTSWDINSSGLEAAILYFSLPVWLYSILLSSVGMLDPENVGLAVEISFLSYLQAEI